MRVNKYYTVSLRKIEMIDGNEICIQSFRIPLSRSYRDRVLELVVINRLINKKWPTISMTRLRQQSFTLSSNYKLDKQP
jgi:hypothetical protein